MSASEEDSFPLEEYLPCKEDGPLGDGGYGEVEKYSLREQKDFSEKKPKMVAVKMFKDFKWAIAHSYVTSTRICTQAFDFFFFLCIARTR